MLDEELLLKFERVLWAQGGLVAQNLRPGATDAELDAVADALGAPLPDEVRLWWTWHDGAGPPRPGAAAATIGPGRPFLPIARALSDTVEAREILSWNADDLIHRSIIIDGAAKPAMVEITGEASAPCPDRSVIFEDPVSAASGLPSMRSLVEAWIDAYERGIWRYTAIGTVRRRWGTRRRRSWSERR